MRTIFLDKIASVTRNLKLGREVKVSDDFPCNEGDVVAVRLLSRKSTYNELELPTGRFSLLSPGDVIVGALGHRRALSGYAGHMPESLAVGDEIHLLNLGGVLGICDSSNPAIGAPFVGEVLGQVLRFPYLAERIGVPANIQDGCMPLLNGFNARGVPVVAVCGTCMNCGKTSAITALIQELVRNHLNVHAAKATGVSLSRDTLAMEDAGASRAISFTDFGIVTTTRETAPRATSTMIHELARHKPDVIVLELGDGLMGDYGVDTILEDSFIRKSLTALVFAANDPVGAWGGIQQLRNRFEIPVTVVTGPATDNTAGTDVIRTALEVPAFNARTDPQALAQCVLETMPRPTMSTRTGKDTL